LREEKSKRANFVRSFYVNRLEDNRSNVNGRNDVDNDNGRLVEYSGLLLGLNMYEQLCSYENLLLAFKKARKGKTRKDYVIKFEKDLENNLNKLREELISQKYQPKPLKSFIIRDPKTRKISKSKFRDRVIHHALINIIGNLFEKSFIYDSYANQIGKGTLKAIERFNFFKGKVSRNFTRESYVLKADIRHYFEEVNHEILINILRGKAKNEQIIWLVNQILKNLSPIGGGGERYFTERNAVGQSHIAILC